MKLLHLSDLHIGRKLKGFPLIEDQKHILNEIFNIAKKEEVNGVIISGDIYDTSIPNTEAINLFDKFISDMNNEGIACYIVSGNHDNVYRVSFGSSIMAKENIHFAKRYSGELQPIKADKNTCIWLLPFIRPADVREFHNDFTTSNYEEMMKTVLKNIDLDEKKVNILVAHQYITANGVAPERSESETGSLGTLDSIDYSVFDKFDYVALGHIHKPQSMGRKTVRYSGSPLKYSFSEVDHKKSACLIEINKKEVSYTKIPLTPLRDMKEFKGSFEEMMKLRSDDYVHVTLTDDFIPDVKSRLETVFPYLMQIDYDNARTRNESKLEAFDTQAEKSLSENFEEFYFAQNQTELNDNQKKIIEEILEEMEGAL